MAVTINDAAMALCETVGSGAHKLAGVDCVSCQEIQRALDVYADEVVACTLEFQLRAGHPVPTDEWLALRECYKASKAYYIYLARDYTPINYSVTRLMAPLNRWRASIEAVDKVMA